MGESDTKNRRCVFVVKDCLFYQYLCSIGKLKDLLIEGVFLFFKATALKTHRKERTLPQFMGHRIQENHLYV